MGLNVVLMCRLGHPNRIIKKKKSVRSDLSPWQEAKAMNYLNRTKVINSLHSESLQKVK